MVHYRYSRWDGSQLDEMSTQDMIEKLTEQILDGDSINQAMRRMMDRGMTMPNGRRMEGMREMMRRLQEARQRNLEKYNLDSIMDDIAERLDNIIDQERSGIGGRLGDLGPEPGQGEPGEGGEPGQDGEPGQGPPGQPSASGQPGQGGQAGKGGAPSPELEKLLRDMAKKHTDQLDQLPPEVGGRIKQLRNYDFMDPEARQQFEELLETLQKQVMQNYFKGIQQGLENMTEEDLSRMSEMVKDLNELTQQKLNGEDPDISDFMAKWGDFFPPGIENFDQLAQHMQEQMAQMQSLMNSMSPEQRSELQGMMEALLRDNRLQWDMYELAFNLQRLSPDANQGERFSMTGDEPVTLQDALNVMGDLNGMEDIESDIRDAMRHNDPSRIDADRMGRVLGEEAREYAKELQKMMKGLEESGFIKRGEHGLELTSRAMRKIGEKALSDIFKMMHGGQVGDHNRDKKGFGIELTDETKRWEFGDPLTLNTQKTVANAVIRNGKGTPVKLLPEDFEIDQTITQSMASTVIALDMSASMMWAGYFQAGQRVGLALDTLIKSKYPKDNVTTLAFSYFVLPVTSTMLLDTYWVEYGGGTNFQEVLRYSREVLKRQGGNNKQIILITDGEPSTYNQTGQERWEDQLETPRNVFDDDPMAGWGGRRRRRYGSVVEETLKEVRRCTMDGIKINTFMLDQSPELLEFVKMMTKINKGRAFIASPEELGTYVVADYANMRNSVIR
jgi:uncharacterized protein with von Willebrand factor type A (vWA) domain